MTPSATTTAASATSRRHGFADVLDSLVSDTHGETVTLRDMLEIVSRRSFGAVMLLLGAVSISPLTIVPGANWAVAAVTLLFAVQVFRKHPWLPRKVLDMKFQRKTLEAVVDKARFAAHIADRLTKPRLVFLTEPPFVIIPTLACIVAALITFPLGLIPFGPLLPGVSLVMLGIGLTARDGLFLAGALLALGGAVYSVWSQFT